MQLTPASYADMNRPRPSGFWAAAIKTHSGEWLMMLRVVNKVKLQQSIAVCQTLLVSKY